MTQQPNPKNNESDGEQDSKGWEATKEAKKRQQKKNRKQQEMTTTTAATAGKGGGGDAKQPGPAVEKKDSQQPQKEGATRQRPPPTETIQTKEEEQKKEFLKKLSEEDKELEDWKKYKEFKPSANAKKFQLPSPVQQKRVPAGGVVPSDDPEPKVQLISSLMVPSAITEATNYYSTIPSSAMSFADATKKSVIHSRLPPAVIKQGGAGAQVTSELEKPPSPSEPIGASNSVHGVVAGGEQIAEKPHEQPMQPERSSPDVMEPKYVSPRMTKLPAAQMKPKGIDENQLTTANKEGGSTGEEGVQGMELKQDQGQIGKWPDLRMGVPSPAPAQSLLPSSAAHQAYSTGPQFHPYQQQMVMPQQWTMPISGGQPSSQLSPSLSPFQAATMMPSQQSYHPGYGYYAQAPYYSTQFGAYPYSQQAQEVPPGFPNRQQQMGGGGYGSMQPRYYSQQVPSSSQYPPSGMPSVKPVQQQQYYGSVNSGYNQMPVPFNPQSYAGVPYPAGAQNPQMGGQGPFASGGGAFPMSDQQHPNPSDYATAFQRQ